MQLRHILQHDYKVYAVKDGALAIETANEAVPDLICPTLTAFLPSKN
jgi:hypothetical protein